MRVRTGSGQSGAWLGDFPETGLRPGRSHEPADPAQEGSVPRGTGEDWKVAAWHHQGSRDADRRDIQASLTEVATCRVLDALRAGGHHC